MRTPRFASRAASVLALLTATLVGCGDDPGFVPPPPPPIPDGGPERIPPTVDECDPDFAPSVCDSDNDCDNGCFCDGLERCEAGTCVPAVADPCADDVACTEDTCLEEVDRCFRQPRNEFCSDGFACNGFEICNPATPGSGCERGVALSCNDESGCTVDSCDDDIGCVFNRRDLDGDGFLDSRCGGDDCNDDPREGRSIFPGAPENCINRLDDDCDGVRDFNAVTCVPDNDDCETARRLPGPGIFSASTKLLQGDLALSCGGAGSDAVFAFTVPSGLYPGEPVDAVDVGFSALGVARGAVAIRAADRCEGDEDADLRCVGGASPSVLLRSLAPGEYVAIVETASPVDSFDVRLRFDPPTPVPRYDVCNDETDVIRDTGVYQGRFDETDHHYTPSCGFVFGGERRDGAYRLVLDEAKDVTLSLSTEAPTALNESVLAVYQGSCADLEAEGACRTGTSATWSQRGLPAGEYFVVIEPRDLAATTWELEVDITDPIERREGDACSTAIDVSDGRPRTVILDGLEEDARPSCDTFFGAPIRDAVFSFTLTDASDVTVESSVADDPALRFPNTVHSLTLLESWASCGLLRRERACTNDASPNVISRRSLPPGTYYVVVTSDDDSQVSATVSVDIGPATPIPMNDRCDGVVPEVCGDSVVVDDTATWSGFTDDYRGVCVSRFVSSLDGVFKCTLDERSFVSATATRKAPRTTGLTSVWIGEGATCPGSSSGSRCQSTSAGSPVSAAVTADLDPGTWWIVTESRDRDAGDYRLVVVNSPLP